MDGAIFMISVFYVPEQQYLCPNYYVFFQGAPLHHIIWLWCPMVVGKQDYDSQGKVLKHQGTVRGNRPRDAFCEGCLLANHYGCCIRGKLLKICL